MVQRKISPKTLQPVKKILSQTKREIQSLNLRKVKISLNYNSGKTAFYSKLRALFPPCSKQFQYNLNSITRRFTPRYHQNTKACVILLPHLTHQKNYVFNHISMTCIQIHAVLTSLKFYAYWKVLRLLPAVTFSVAINDKIDMQNLVCQRL